MSSEEENDSLEKDYIAAIHLMKYSKDNQQVAEEVVDNDRRCFATKYMVAKKFEFGKEADAILEFSVDKYKETVDAKIGSNNYFPLCEAQCPNVKSNPLEWKSTLGDPTSSLKFLKSLPCRVKNVDSCKKGTVVDRHVENIVEAWKKNERSVDRVRKQAFAEKSTSFEGSLGKYCGSLLDNSRKAHSSTLWRSTRPWKANEIQKSNTGLGKSYCSTGDKRGCISSLESNHNENEEESSDENTEETSRKKYHDFRTAKAELKIQQTNKNNHQQQKKTLGGKPMVNSKFVSPFSKDESNGKKDTKESIEQEPNALGIEDDRLKSIDPKMIELIKNEIMDPGTTITWDDIAGLEFAKNIIQEIVVFPMLRPDLFTGLRRPARGILLFGPPGTGKTLIGKCIASQSKSTFFSISASSLTSKWVGEGEKMVRALFAVATVLQPSVVFIDEIDSLLSQRSETEHESSRRIKTEFLVQLDGAATHEDDRILVIGATNRPQELDEAARRRLVKRLYIPLPDLEARKEIIKNLLKSENHEVTAEDMEEIAKLSNGFSGADMTHLCKEASMGPIRNIPFRELANTRKEDIRKIGISDFKKALSLVSPSVSQSDLNIYLDWDRTYGSGFALKNS